MAKLDPNEERLRRMASNICVANIVGPEKEALKWAIREIERLRVRADCVHLPEDGVPENKWAVLGAASVVELMEAKGLAERALGRVTLERNMRHQLLLDAAMLVRRLCRRLPSEDTVAMAATGWIKRSNLQGNILRKDNDGSEHVHSELAVMLLRDAIIEHCQLMKDAINIMLAGGDKVAVVERLDTGVEALLRASWNTANDEAKDILRQRGINFDAKEGD